MVNKRPFDRVRKEAHMEHIIGIEKALFDLSLWLADYQFYFSVGLVLIGFITCFFLFANEKAR